MIAPSIDGFSRRGAQLYFFCSIAMPQHFNWPVPPLVTITWEAHFVQM
jgi:hypothetical protein